MQLRAPGVDVGVNGGTSGGNLNLGSTAQLDAGPVSASSVHSAAIGHSGYSTHQASAFSVAGVGSEYKMHDVDLSGSGLTEHNKQGFSLGGYSVNKDATASLGPQGMSMSETDTIGCCGKSATLSCGCTNGCCNCCGISCGSCRSCIPSKLPNCCCNISCCKDISLKGMLEGLSGLLSCLTKRL